MKNYKKIKKYLKIYEQGETLKLKLIELKAKGNYYLNGLDVSLFDSKCENFCDVLIAEIDAILLTAETELDKVT